MIGSAFLYLVHPPVAAAVVLGATDSAGMGLREILFGICALLFVHSLFVCLAGSAPFAGCWRTPRRGLGQRERQLNGSESRPAQAQGHAERRRGAAVPSFSAGARVKSFAKAPRAGLAWQAGSLRSGARGDPGPRALPPLRVTTTRRRLRAAR